MSAFDLASLDTRTRSEQGVAMEIIHPKTRAPVLREDGRPVTITLLGANSDIFSDVARRMRDRNSDRVNKGVRVSPDDMRNDEFEYLVACTVDWTIEEMDGKPFPFSRENARKLWADRRFNWLFREALNFISVEGNFLVEAAAPAATPVSSGE